MWAERRQVNLNLRLISATLAAGREQKMLEFHPISKLPVINSPIPTTYHTEQRRVLLMRNSKQVRMSVYVKKNYFTVTLARLKGRQAALG